MVAVLRDGPEVSAKKRRSKAKQLARVPLIELGLEVHDVHEASAGREVAFDVFHARFDLALGLCPVGAAQPSRGSNPQYSENALKVGFQTRRPSSSG